MFADEHIRMMQTLADQASIAISNARLFQQVQEQTRQLSASLSDLRAAQDRLVQTEKLASLGQLTAGIAHEIKNPLNFVNNFSSLSGELIDELCETLEPIDLEDKTRLQISELTAMLKGRSRQNRPARQTSGFHRQKHVAALARRLKQTAAWTSTRLSKRA